MLVLEVGLAMVPNNPVGIGGRHGLLIGGCDLAVQCVVKSLEKSLPEVHISNWVDRALNLHRTRHLPVVMRPVVFELLHVPLVHYHDNALGLRLVHLSEQILSTLVYQCRLQVREEVCHARYVPVYHVPVQALLAEGSRAYQL
jgi:hypothetical protein